MNERMLERAKGCLGGLAVGDALGQPTKGWSPQAVRERWGVIEGFVGEAALSDDTEYTLFSARALLDYGPGITSEDVANEWLAQIVPQAGPFKGAGFSEMAAIDNLRRGVRPPESGRHYHSWSDGLAMRVAPFGIVAAGNPQEACRLAHVDGVVSHAGEGLYGGYAVAAAISVAMTGAPLGTVVQAALDAVPEDSWTGRNIRVALEVAASADDVPLALHDALAVVYYPWTDLAPEAVGLAFGLLAAGGGRFRESLLAAVNLGRDADTIAAIIGAILGAQLGYEELPEDWRGAVGTATGRCLRCVTGMNLLEVARDLTAFGEVHVA
jgi:ADP-ribosylglycohydrolase